MNATEKTITRMVVEGLLSEGAQVGVRDPEMGGWLQAPTREMSAILAACGQMDETTLSAQAEDGRRIGSVLLVYGNDIDLLTDHTDTPEMNRLLSKVNDYVLTL